MTKFPSKRDWWITLLLWSGVGLSLAMMAPAFALASRIEIAVLLLIVLAVDAVVLWVLYGTVYWFDESTLRIRSGPLRLSVPLEQIDSVKPSRDARSSPALSLDRLVLRYGPGWVLISPRDRDAFIDELQRRCPRVERIDC